MDLPIATNSVSFANADTPPASGTPQYFTNGNPATSTPATVLPGYWLNGIAEEIVTGLIAGAGITADRNTLTQIMQAVKRVAGGNLSTVTANTTLTADNAGLVLVNAAGGNVALTLPAANGMNGLPMRFAFVRTDTSANTVTITAAGSDTIGPMAATSVTLTAAGDTMQLTSNGSNGWVLPSATRTRPKPSFYGTAGSYTLPVPPGFTQARVRAWGGGGGSGGSSSTDSAGAGAGGNYAEDTLSEIGGATLTITVGAGGTGGASTPTAGGAGGASSVAIGGTTYVLANGGLGGAAGAASANGGLPGAAGTGTIQGTGAQGSGGGATVGGIGGSAAMGGGGGGGPHTGSTNAGSPGGGGGAPSSGNIAGTAGAPGAVIVEFF